MTNIEGYGEGGSAFGPSPEPASFLGRGGFEPHPLFPREDGLPEDRDIQYVTFRRRRTGDRLVQNYPEDIPASDVQSWAQVVAWWGGGEYKVIGKNAKHQIEAYYPPAADAWESFDGESKPFTFRDSSPYASRAPAMGRSAERMAPPPSPPSSTSARGHVEQSGLQSELIELVRELRAERVARAAAPPPVIAPSPAQPIQLDNNAVLIALINAQAQSAASAAARESENMRAFMSAMLSFKQGPEPTTVAVSLLKAVKDMAQPQSSVNETLNQFKVLKDLTSPTAALGPGPAGAGSELGEIFSGLTSFMQAEASRSTIANLSRSTRDEEPPEPRARSSDEPPQRKRDLVRVPGLGIVEVVRPEPPTFMPYPPPPLPPPVLPPSAPPRVQHELDIEAIKRDPALRAKLLHALGVEPSPPPLMVMDPPASAPPLSKPPRVATAPIENTTPMEAPAVQPPPMKMNPPAVEPDPLPSSPAVSDPGTMPAASAPVVVAPAVVAPAVVVESAASAAPMESTPAAPSPANDVQLAPELSTSPIPAPAPNVDLVAPPAVAPARERRVIALPAQMPHYEPQPSETSERERARSWFERLRTMPADQRRKEIAKLPGSAGCVEELTMLFGELPPDAWQTVIEKLPPEVRRKLAEA